MKALVAILLLGCTAAQAGDMIDLHYLDSEGGEAGYTTRILVTERYLRMDNGNDDADFVLFDRKTGKVSNVIHAQRMLMSIQEKKLPKRPSPAYRVVKKVTEVRPGTVRVQVLANGKLCSETVAAASLYPDAARALAEYKAALAYTQWVTYRNTPAELRQNCDLVHHVWQTDMSLSRGLPIEERDYAGRVRQYVSGERRRLVPALFELPTNYEPFMLPAAGGMGAGKNPQP